MGEEQTMSPDQHATDAQARAIAELLQAAQNAADFLQACEWNDRTSETDAANIAQRLTDAIVAAELRADRPPEGWQPIETAPEATYVHVYVPNRGILIATKTTHASDGALWWSGAEIVSRPTHWMPLPSPPVSAPSVDVDHD